MFKICSLFAFLVVAITLNGCSTTGSARYEADFNRYKIVRFDESIGVFDHKYLPIVARALERCGFRISTGKADEGELVCKFQTDQANVFNFRVHISLWDGNQMLIIAEAVNSGWGTLIARDVAEDSLIRDAIEQLETDIRNSRNKNK
jgi:hypothetical protein